MSILLCAASIASAQESEPTALDLVYQSFDLKYSSEDLGGAADGVKGKAENTGGAPVALKSEVVDLKAAGADIKESESEIKISLQGEILFDFDKATLRSAAEATLAGVASLIKKYPKPTVLIEGHTDGKGSQSYNQKLSERRAVSVKNWLAAHGIADRAIRTNGLGASRPVAPNAKPDGSDDPEGRQKNRRVEITIKK
ncbi:MAG: hypothetical protein QOI04_866 [Verrucomicrobiota bacterium]